MPPIPDLCMGIARAVRDGRDEEAAELRVDLKAAKLEAKIREAVDAAPPLRPDQIERLRALLTPSAAPAPSTSEAA